MEKMTAQEIEQKRAGEKETVDCMIGIYCRGVHGTKRGELCEACRQLQAYADLRTEKCPFMETKTFCSACKVHCYSKEMQEKIREVMKYAGPRMLFVHPLLAIRHVHITLRNKKKAERDQYKGKRERNMFHKRLLKEFSDNRKYVAGMVIMQWAALLANVALMYVLAAYVGRISGIVKGESLTASPSDGVLLIVFAAALFVRIAATSAANRMSYLASTQVKRRLRDRIYEKMMEFGAAYREAVATSEAVQIATEGVDQLEIYFGKYVPQFFYSMLAPLTLFVIVGTMSIKVAAVLLLCVPLIPVSIVAVQKFAKKLLAKYWGTYTELGDSFLENLQGLVTLKIYQADGRYAKKMDEEAEKFRKVTIARADHAAEFDQRDGSGCLRRSGARHHLKRA